MLKSILFLLLLFVSNQAYAIPNSNTIMADIQQQIEQGNKTAAIDSLQHLVQKEPKNYQAWFLLGISQAEQQQFEAAINAFHQVVALQPKLAEPHNNLAVIYNERGDIKAAVNELETSVVLKPGYATAQKNLGDLYVKLAADAYQKALSSNKSPALQRRYQGLLQLTSDTNNSILPAAMPTKAPPAPSTTPASSPVKQTTMITPTPANTIAPEHFNNTATQAVLQALETWRAAWSNKDTSAYFSTYSDDFNYGSRYQSLLKWRDYKTWAIQKRRFIHVDIEHIVSTIISETEIKISFLQHFRSDSFNSDDHKEMVFKHTTNGWKISYEASL